MNPIELPGNQFEHFYEGGASIAAFRGSGTARPRTPEDWVGSTTSRAGEERLGLTTLADGTLLVDAVNADPLAWLGAAHLEAFGSSTELLVKLLDAEARLVVHAHPDRRFARQHLGCAHGKTEAWVVLETASADAAVFLGFQRDVAATVLTDWVREQHTEEMLAAMNRLTVRPGDTVLVPAGLPHAVGAGIFIAELQEPTDLSILMEWKGFNIDAADGHLGLGHDLALTAVDRSAWDAARLAGLRGSLDGDAARELVLPRAADPFFRAERLRDGATCEPSFAILVVLEGDGVLDAGSVRRPIRRGQTWLIPHAAGPTAVHGAVSVLRCLPPAP